MANTEVKVGDAGTEFVLTVKDSKGAIVDISGATTPKTVSLKMADATTASRTWSFKTDGVDGKLKWTAIAGDLDIEGPLRMEAYVKLASGEWRTTTATIEIRPAL